MSKHKYNRLVNKYGNAGALNSIGTGLLSNAGSMASMFPGVGTAVGIGLLAASTIFDALTNVDLLAVSLAESSLENVLKFSFDTSSADALSSQYGKVKATTDYEGSDLGGPLSLVAAAKARELNELGQDANTAINAKFGLATKMVNQNQFLLGLANISADGGGIHIAPSKRGTFTAAASKHNMGVQEFASRVLANKENYSPSMVKKANFSRNAAKWHHAFGGDIALTPDALSYTNLYLNSVEPVENPVYTDRDYFWANVYRDRNNKFYIPGYGGTDYYITEEEAKKRVQDFRKNVDKPTKRDIEVFLKETDKNKKSFGGDLNTNGSNFDLGFNYFANGGSHELNPYEGVLIGVDLQGIPNLVEEGEVRVDNYIFSKRLKNPRTKNTFAKDALKANKEAEERPNDVISKNGLKAAMEQLIQEQEGVREENMNNQYKLGGRLANKYDTAGFLSTLNPNSVLGLTFSKDLNNPYADNSWKSNLTLPTTPLGTSAKKGASKLNIDPTKLNTAARIIGGLAPALGLVHNLANPTDYSNAEKIEKAAKNIRDVQPRATLTQKARPLVFDPHLEEAIANAQYNAAVDRAVDLAGGNRAAANALVLALNYNMQNQVGARARQNQKDIFAAGLQQQGFNRETDKANIATQLQADIQNQAADYQRAQLLAQAAAFREQLDLARATSIMGNANTLFENIGAMGKEGYMMDMIRNNPALLYDWMGNYKSNGGKIRRKGGKHA